MGVTFGDSLSILIIYEAAAAKIPKVTTKMATQLGLSPVDINLLRQYNSIIRYTYSTQILP